MLWKEPLKVVFIVCYKVNNLVIWYFECLITTVYSDKTLIKFELHSKYAKTQLQFGMSNIMLLLILNIYLLSLYDYFNDFEDSV